MIEGKNKLEWEALGGGAQRSAAVHDVIDITGTQCGNRQIRAHGHKFQFESRVGKDPVMDTEVKRCVHHRDHRLSHANLSRRGARPWRHQETDDKGF
ncbi:MAG: hypothetical protein K0Q83_3770 [Deltaproteobacteria bacterium]|nr:hypothetical protein [Deltaproteobacteria bacterium]